MTPQWEIAGSYFEACNCDAVCPCRRQGDGGGGRSTYGHCDFVLSWCIEKGYANGTDLSDRTVVLAGTYDDDEPGQPWSVVLYIDEQSSAEQSKALEDIFLGRVGGGTFANYAAAIGTVLAVRPAAIALDHTPNAERIGVGTTVTVRTREPVDHAEPVSCGIPGHDHPGQEVIAELMRVDDPALSWEVHGRCGFATEFAYRSDMG